MAYPGSLPGLYRETEGVEYNDWEGYSTDDVLVYNPCNPHNSGLDFAGLQMHLTWHNQDNTGLDLRESQKDLPCQNQGVAHFSPTIDKREKKRLIDKAYREREKHKRKKMQSDLVLVGGENKDLKRENGRLRSEKDVMDQSLQARAAENQVLKTQVRCLKRKADNQQVLVDAFSRELCNVEDQQLLKLRQERDRLLGNVTWNPQMKEQKQLLERKVYLEHQNIALKFQASALCEKILNDKNH